MRFLEDGPDIPDELIDQVRAGRAVFLCGAGVSRRVGLPLFKELTDKIYARLGETRDNDPAEQDAFARNEFDRVLRALEKRLKLVGDRSRVRDACATELAPPNVDLPDHRALLFLSRDKNGRPRLLTTNFDTLFEHAGKVFMPPPRSYAVKAMPKPAGLTDHGILHLHGRVSDPVLGLDESDLILTSADFGDAYLRDGWASQYIEDRIRTSVLVLVGYQAEDAALRLLLETLDVDRKRFPDLCKIYALDRETAISRAIWDAKGIMPVEAKGYDVLYASIREWAEYAKDPGEYAKAKVATILAKDPASTSDFEREQLSFLIAQDQPARLLVQNNPSLAWLHTLADLKLVGHDQPWLVEWFELNLENPDAVRDVVANIGLLGTKVGDFLDYRLRHLKKPLSSLYAIAWGLIVRHLKTAGRDHLDDRWFLLEPRLGSGETTPEVMDLLTNLLRPTVRVSKRFTIGDRSASPASSLRDLMAVDFETDENIDVDQIMRLWPKTSPLDQDLKLLTRLCDALDQTLDDLEALGLEASGEFTATDSDVPSVADHPQNSYRHGFLPIVRVIAELWTRIAEKDANAARRFVTRWTQSQHKLDRRLALFAATDPIVTPEMAADVLSHVPREEFFFSNSTVELFRLLEKRWPTLPEPTRRAIEARFIEGAPEDAFREGADVARLIDRERYESIGALKRLGYALSGRALATFDDIQARYPEWQLRPAAQTGFHIWTGEVTSVGESDVKNLTGVADGDLVATARRLDSAAEFHDGNNWSTLCNTDPPRALRGLLAEASAGRWNAETWRPLLWSRPANPPSDFAEAVAQALVQWPEASFAEIAKPAAGWLETPPALALGDVFWDVWDRVLRNIPAETDEGDPARYFERAINTPPGNLAEAVLKRTPPPRADLALPPSIEHRLTVLCSLPGHNGALACARLATDVAFLFARAPQWTTANIVPLFSWDHPLALAAWSARIYANTIGSPALFALMKQPFLELFARAEVPSKLKEDYADWLLVPLFSNQAHNTGYDLTTLEARAALRRIGPNALWQIGHRFAIEMEAAKEDEKLKVWREIVGPVFRGTWPLDAELQTPRANFKLVQMLRATGDAFPEAVDQVIPFVTPESGEPYGTTLFSLGDADNVLYALAPRKLLDLVDALVGDNDAGSIYGLRKVLDRLLETDPTIAGSPKYQRLRLIARDI